MIEGNESFRVDSYVVDVLLRDLVGHDHCAAAFLVYLFLWRRTRGERQTTVRLSHQAVADETGMSKSAVQQAMRVLHRRGLVKSTRARLTDTPEHEISRPWACSKPRANRNRVG